MKTLVAVAILAMVAPYKRAFHGWFGPERVPSSRTGARWQSAHRLRRLAEPERGEVAPMRHDMVGDGRWGDAVRFQGKADTVVRS